MPVAMKVVLVVVGAGLFFSARAFKVDPYTYEMMRLYHKRELHICVAIKFAMFAASIALCSWAVFS